MKKLYISLLAAFAMVPVASTAQTELTSLWGNIIVENNVNIGIGSSRASDGSLFFVNNIGSSTTSQTINLTHGNSTGTTTSQIASGSVYSGSSYNNGISVIKTDANGNLLWNVWSDAGELYSGNGGVIATDDGGATVVLKVRHSSGYGTTPIHLVSSNGSEYTYSDWVLDAATSSRYYKGINLHFDSTGSVAWYRVINVDTTPQPEATSNYQALTSDALTITEITSDSNGDIYLVGNYRNPVTFATADGTIVITPRNTKGWSGDSQNSVGDLYVAKFGSDGYAKKVFTTSGDTITYETVTTLSIEGSTLYLQGTIKGTGTGTVSVGGVELTPDASNNLLIARLDTAFNVQWARALPSTYTSAAYQSTHLDVIDSKLYLTGKFRFNITDGDVSLDCSTKSRDAALLVFDPQTGALQNAVSNGTTQSGFCGAFTVDNDTDTDNFYVYGHTLSNPLFLQKRNKSTLELVDTYYLTTNKTAAYLPPIVSGDTIFTQTRYYSSSTFFSDTDSPVTTAAYSTYMAAYKLPVTVATVIEGVNEPKTVARVKYYNLQGIQFNEPQDGLNIVVTEYTDGSRSTSKVIR